MRRSIQDRSRARHHSQPGSVAGDDGDLSDVEPSESGSVSAHSAATGGSRRHRTIEEREAAYNEARMRIFKDLEDKEKQKDKDMSANSSTFSLVSGSGSTSGGRSSMGDLDDSASSAATESEWSGPSRDKRDNRTRGPGTSSSRTYTVQNGSSSSRNSRATSPSYPTMYDAPSGTPYDSSYMPPNGYTHYTQYYPPYPPPPPPPHGSQFISPFWYGPYPANHPQSPPHAPDTTGPSDPSVYPSPPPPPPPPPMTYMGQYWPPPGQSPPGVPPGPTPPMNPPHPGPPPPPLQHSTSSQGHPVPQNMQYAYPTPGPYGPYPQGGYYAPHAYQPGQQPYPPPVPPQPYYPEMVPHPEAMGPPMMGGHGLDNSNVSRTSSRNSNGHTNGAGRRGAPRARQSWSYGSGPTTTGLTHNHNISGHDAVGPRLNTRRTSNNSTSSGGGGNRTGDESSSTTVSSLFR